MENILKFNLNWNYKTVSFFTFLLIVPNILGTVNLATPFGFKIHFFQVAVILAAIIYGPSGGALSGLVGSMYSAMIMHNPYIVGGNIILGFFVGFLVRYKWNVIVAVWAAYLIQLPWLIITDYYLIGLPIPVITALILTLLISNSVWAVVANYLANPIKNLLE